MKQPQGATLMAGCSISLRLPAVTALTSPSLQMCCRLAAAGLWAAARASLPSQAQRQRESSCWRKCSGRQCFAGRAGDLGGTCMNHGWCQPKLSGLAKAHDSN